MNEKKDENYILRGIQLYNYASITYKIQLFLV